MSSSAELTADGMKTTCTEHAAPVRTTGGQLFVSAKSNAFMPATLIELIASEPELAFITVTVCGALEIPSLCGGKLKLVGVI